MSSGDIVRFGKYRLIRHLATGGMGEVHLAKLKGPSGFEKLVIIKRLLDERQNVKKYVDMFFSEARVAAQLNHPNIAQIYEVGTLDEAHYIAMEYVQGQSLRKILDVIHARGGTLPPAYTIQIMVELCHGLGYAHDARHLSGAPMGLIHRDVNPQNILVNYAGTVKVIDFGIAKSELTLEQTQAGLIKGTVVYMSPEQSSGYKLTRRSDIFSVGICLYEALTGTNPFYKDSVTAALEAIRTVAFPPLSSIRPDLAFFAPIIDKTMAASPDSRYSSCKELSDALSAILDTGMVRRPEQTLGDFLQNLFADDMAAEAHMLEKTELVEFSVEAESSAEAYLSKTVALPDRDKTVLDKATLSVATSHSNPSAEIPLLPAAAVVTFDEVPQDKVEPPRTFMQQLRQLWQQHRWLRYGVWAASAGALYGLFALLAQLSSPVSTEVPHTTLPQPQQAPPSTNEPSAEIPAESLNPPRSSPARPPMGHLSVEGEGEPKKTGARRPMPTHRRDKSRIDVPLSNTLRFQVEPQQRVLFNGAPLVNNSFRIRAASGAFQIGSGSDPLSDPFTIHLRYRIENKAIIYSIDSEPWANLVGAGGITLGRTPVQDIAGSTTTVFELQNPKDHRFTRLVLRLAGP